MPDTVHIENTPEAVNLRILGGDSFQFARVYREGGALVDFSADEIEVVLTNNRGTDLLTLTVDDGVKVDDRGNVTIDITQAQTSTDLPGNTGIQWRARWIRDSDGRAKTLARGLVDFVNDIT